MAKRQKNQTEKDKPIEICHLRLDYDLARRGGELERMRKIKEINGYLQNLQYISSSADSKGQSVDSTKLALARYFGKECAASPVIGLVDRGLASGEEIMAADEIDTAVRAVAGATMIKSACLERVDGGRTPPEWDQRTGVAVTNFKRWANHWSALAKQRSDCMLRCVYSAVIEHRSISALAYDLGLGHHKVAHAVVSGLRDYAARAGWVDRQMAQKWISDADKAFMRLV